MSNKEMFNKLLNSCQHPWGVYTALLALGRAGLLEKPGKEAARS